jgi:hypothetical protein
MPTKQIHQNCLAEYFGNLDLKKARVFRLLVQDELGISKATFYNRLRDPSNAYKKPEKLAIAKLAGVPDHFLFPELKTAEV